MSCSSRLHGHRCRRTVPGHTVHHWWSIRPDVDRLVWTDEQADALCAKCGWWRPVSGHTGCAICIGLVKPNAKYFELMDSHR